MTELSETTTPGTIPAGVAQMGEQHELQECPCCEKFFPVDEMMSNGKCENCDWNYGFENQDFDDGS